MERGHHYQQGQIIEIDVEDPVTERSLGVNKTCGEAPCGFSDVGFVSKDAQERSASMRKLFISVGLCFVFMSIEVVGGIKANSLAILTDAAHLLSDVAAFAISLFALWAAGWEANPRQSYGFFRIEILGALVSIQLIWLLAGILVYEAIVRLIHDTGEVNGFLMFLVSAFGLLVNIIMALVLGHDHGHDHRHGGYDHHGHGHDHGHGGNDHHGHGHDHGHGGSGHNNGVKIATHNHPHKDEKHHHENHDLNHDHDHDHDHEEGNTQPLLDRSSDDKDGTNNNVKGSKKWNINVQGAYLHVLGDSIQSVGVMIGGAVIWYEPKWKIIDLICTLIFSVVVLGTTIKMLRNILEVLMESTPKEIDASKVENGLLEMEEVVAIHELHIWAITVGKILLACHVKVFPESDADIVLNKVIDYLRREYNITHVTIQIEH